MWTDLSIKDKSDLMRIFLNNGVSSLSDMRRIYDGEQDTTNPFKKVSTIEDRPKEPEPVIDKNWLKEYKDLPSLYKKAINEVFQKMNFGTNDYEALYNSNKYWNIISEYYGGVPSYRLRENDSPTKKQSEAYERSMNKLIYNRKGYGSPNMKYAIPYNESKEIVIPTIGRVPTNALDSIAKYSYQAGLPLYEGLGLSGQETNFGATPTFNMKSIPKNASQKEQDNIKFFNRVLGNTSYFRNYGYIPAEYMVRDFRYNLEGHAIDRNIPPLLHAFQYYKKGKYNPGDPNHTSDVRKKGQFIMNTKPIQDWIKSSLYAQKALQINNGNITNNLKAFGGRIYDGEQNIKEEIESGKKLSDYADTTYSLKTFNSPFLEPDTLLLRTLPQEQDISAEEDTIDERLSSGHFHIPNDLPEVSFTQKVLEINKNKKVKDIKNLSKSEIIELQKKFANEGLYDKKLTYGKSSTAKEIQSYLKRKGYLKPDEVDSIMGKKTVTALQQMLVDKGYLEDLNENGKSNIDGFLGPKTREAYKKFNRDFNIDGVAGEKTINIYKNIVNNNYSKEVSAKGMTDQCAAWVSKKYDSITNSSKQDGVYGNAWTMIKNIEDSGGKILFNIYDNPAFDNVQNALDIKKAVENNKGNIDYSNLLPGDIVAIHNPSSTHYSDVLKEGTTYNTHVGIVVGFDENNIPIIEHNIQGKIRKEKINNITGSISGKPIVTAAVRPKQSGVSVESLDFDSSIHSKYYIEGKEEYNNQLMKEYMDSLAQTKEVYKNIFEDVDLDFIEKAAIGILKRETNFMSNKPSDNKNKPSFIARNLYHKIMKTPEDIISQDLTKTKFTSLSKNYRDAIGLTSPEQLSTNPTIAGRAVMTILAKNYDYFNRLATQNPDLELSKEDIENATIYSYNIGLGNLASLGFDTEGKYDKSELNYFRKISNPDNLIKDVSSTNYKYLGKLGEFIYDKTGDAKPSYIGAARNAINLIKEKV